MSVRLACRLAAALDIEFENLLAGPPDPEGGGVTNPPKVTRDK
jgi:hypothetical protein